MFLYNLTKDTTPQQFFDAIKEGVKAGNFPSVHSSKLNILERPLCLYRNEDNTKCCVMGMFIPEEKYNPELENKLASKVIHLLNLEVPDFIKNNETLLNMLQGVHDRLSDKWNNEEFIENCKCVINKYVKETQVI